MRNISISQVFVLIIICFLLFGDIHNFKKKLVESVKQYTTYFNKNRKKGD